VDPDLDAWEPWTPEQLAERMAGLDVPWYVAGGWAIDLHAGRVTREHEDLEVAVPGDRFDELASRFPEMDFWVPDGESSLVPMSEATLAGESHQTWARERATERWRFDVFREPHDGDLWICRRDESIRLPYSQVVVRTASGIPYAVPEVVLLFKAKAARDKDRADLDLTLPLMGDERRRWLREALAQVHPDHEWLEIV
jgi:hypothetical protein